VLDLYRAAILPVWLAAGRDHDFGRIEANIRARLGDPDYGMSVTAFAEGDELAGYLAWERHPDHTSRHTVAHLRMILVHPKHQGSGLGAALMARFEAAARAAGCSKVLFDVVTGSPARRFYEGLGYHHWSDYLEKVLD
jgi:GNAT superfamily N-acetyltransferase